MHVVVQAHLQCVRGHFDSRRSKIGDTLVDKPIERGKWSWLVYFKMPYFKIDVIGFRGCHGKLELWGVS